VSLALKISSSSQGRDLHTCIQANDWHIAFNGHCAFQASRSCSSLLFAGVVETLLEPRWAEIVTVANLAARDSLGICLPRPHQPHEHLAPEGVDRRPGTYHALGCDRERVVVRPVPGFCTAPKPDFFFPGTPQTLLPTFLVYGSGAVSAVVVKDGRRLRATSFLLSSQTTSFSYPVLGQVRCNCQTRGFSKLLVSIAASADSLHRRLA
jgi:hypothetical protein